jgi:uncharacterized GH25 family protein
MRRLLATVVIAVAFVVVSPLAGDAHFIWIETEPVAQPGTSHEINLYFGEPHEFLREEAGGLLDRHDALQAWVVDPAGEKRPLMLRKERNHFHTSFTPTRPGRHQIVASNENYPLRDVDGGATRAVFFARAQVLAFETGRISSRDREITEVLPYDIVPVTRHLDPVAGTITARRGQEVAVRLLANGQPVRQRRLQVHAPNGWIKEVSPTDAWGVTSFVPLWPGRYVVTLERDEPSGGELNGKKYLTISRRVSLVVIVEKDVRAP